ncbi:MAG: hypothetical protein CME62_08955 [Halobacteriovoraceae bacterium]|nr:hypothetical protein [Halobacteriovoraceae bacterium]|tara:strand:- start:4941 stop:6251 length:1311 start_codon:yes stop_codon:yes gene_type:complete
MIKLLTENQLKIIKNFNWLFFAYIYRFLIGFITLSFVTKYLGPKEYGIYAYSLSLFSFVEMFLLFINQEVFKKSVLEDKNESVLIKTAILFQFFLAIMIIFIINTLLWQFELESGYRRSLLSIFSIGLLFRPWDMLSFYFSANMRNDLISKTEASTVTLFNGLRLLLVFFKRSLIDFGWAMLFSKIINSLFLFFYFKKSFRVSLSSARFDSSILYKLIRSSLPLFIATAATIVFTRIDQVMLGNLLSDEAVGIYAVVVKLSEPWIFIAAILTQSVYPDLVRRFRENKENFEYKVKKTLCILFYISLAIILGTQIFGEFVINLVFSSQYSESIPLLKVHIFYLIFIYWTHVTNQYDVINGVTHITLIKTVAASVVNVLLNIFLIERIGVIGASYATIASYSLSSFFINLCFQKTRRLFVLQLESLLFWRITWLHKKN